MVTAMTMTMVIEKLQWKQVCVEQLCCYGSRSCVVGASDIVEAGFCLQHHSRSRTRYWDKSTRMTNRDSPALRIKDWHVFMSWTISMECLEHAWAFDSLFAETFGHRVHLDVWWRVKKSLHIIFFRVLLDHLDSLRSLMSLHD